MKGQILSIVLAAAMIAAALVLGDNLVHIF